MLNVFTGLKSVFSLLAVIGIFSFIGFAQDIYPEKQVNDLPNLKIEDINFERSNFVSSLKQLAQIYNFPMGIECGLNYDEQIPVVFIFKSGTLSELLDKVTAQNNFAWEIKDGVVNIFPKTNQADSRLRKILETEIGIFSVKKQESLADVEKAMFMKPEVRKVLFQAGMKYPDRAPGGFRTLRIGKNYSVEITNMTVRTIMNKLLRENSTTNFWVIQSGKLDPESVYVDWEGYGETQFETTPRETDKLLPKMNVSVITAHGIGGNQNSADR